MEVYKYTKLVSETGKNGLIALAICAIIAAFFFYKTMNKSGESSQYTLYIAIALGVFLLVAGQKMFARLNSTAAWDIEIDDERLSWNAPELVDTSFIVNLRDISLVEKSWERDRNDATYILRMKDGSDIVLSEASEIDFDSFVEALQRRGVSYKETEEPAHQ